MTFLCITVSLLGIAYLAVTNPKRRRAFDQTELTTRAWVWPARAAVLIPLAFLTFTANWSGLSIWAGTVTVIGWIIAAISPERSLAVKQCAFSFAGDMITYGKATSGILAEKFFDLYQTAGSKKLREKVTEYETKIAMLEERIGQLEQSQNEQDRPDKADLKIVNR